MIELFDVYLRKMLNIVGLFKNFGRTFFTEWRRINSIKDVEAMDELSQQYLRALLLHAYINVPYYRNIMKSYDVEDIRELSIFHEMPLLTKDMIRRHFNELVSLDLGSRKWYYNTSGGSTGEPVKFIQDNLFDMWRTIAYQYYYKNVLRIDEPVVRKVLLWGSERDLFGSSRVKSGIKWFLLNTKFFNTFRMTRDDMYKALKVINSFKPDIIRGYATSLYELARFAEERHISISWRPKAVISTAEPLSDHMREVISRVFNTRVYNFYGSREVSAIAGECEEGLLHLFSFHNFVEIINPNTERSVNEGEEGLVVITNLHNYSMPLIRYVIEDVAVLGPRRCKCGIPTPTLKRVVGRVVDNFITSNGTIIYGDYFTHLFYFRDWVKSFRVIQEDYDLIRILVVPKGDINRKDLEDIENKIRLVMGSNCKIVWEFVDEIPKTREGKHLYTISHVWRR